MREALAAADHDFILSEQDPRQNPMRDEQSIKGRRVTSRRKKRRRNYTLPICAGLCVAAVAGIVVNALTLQKTRHPAPLFAHGAPPSPAREPLIAETAPVPAPRPAANALSVPAPAEKGLERPLAERPAAHARQIPSQENAAGEEESRDPISQLLKAPAAKSAPSAKAPAVKPPAAKQQAAEKSPVPAAGGTTPDKKVLAAQRALVKLGFVLKPDGVAGATTRQAIERYERDRGRPVHGVLTPALSRQLSAESGVPIR